MYLHSCEALFIFSKNTNVSLLNCKNKILLKESNKWEYQNFPSVTTSALKFCRRLEIMGCQEAFNNILLYNKPDTHRGNKTNSFHIYKTYSSQWMTRYCKKCQVIKLICLKNKKTSTVEGKFVFLITKLDCSGHFLSIEGPRTGGREGTKEGQGAAVN